MRDRQREGYLLDRPCPSRLRGAAHLERQLQLRPHRRRHDLRLGVLRHESDGASQLGRAVLANVEARDLDFARDLAPVVVRNEAAAGPQQRRLPRPRAPREDDQLTGLDLEIDAAQGLAVGARVAVAERADADEGLGVHAPLLRRASANGIAAARGSSKARATVAASASTRITG